ncbi:hypothetical protein [Maribacter sp. R77961]|uniref:hypothetical protein n=1 Tax=Maribacter sp. R77961 TaxID=3093871 RepID=UPI0037CB869C
MEKNSNYKNIERRIKEVANDYTLKGYDVIIYPNHTNLPNFLKNFEPDILAKKDDFNVIIEVKTRNNQTDFKKLEFLAKEIESRKNWRFELVFTNPRVKQIKTNEFTVLSELAINNRLLEINKLIEIESFEASFLLSWATIESVLRKKLNDEKSKTDKSPTLSVIRNMFSLGLINQHDYKTLQKSNSLRNNLIHGFEQNIDRNSVQKLVQIINYLTGQNNESEWLEWLNAVDLENYEEIYSLYLTALNNESYGLFDVTEEMENIVLKADHMDEVLIFEDSSSLRSFAEFVEEEYMDEMGAEGYYAFHRAMEKDD